MADAEKDKKPTKEEKPDLNVVEGGKDAVPEKTPDTTSHEDTEPHEDGVYPTFKGTFVDKGRAPVKAPLIARFLLKAIRLGVQALIVCIFVPVVVVAFGNIGSAVAVSLVNAGAIGSMDIIMVFAAICGGGAAGALYLVPRLWNGMNWVCWTVKGAWRSRKGGR